MIDVHILHAALVIAGILVLLLIVWIFFRLRANRATVTPGALTDEKTEADDGIVRLPGWIERGSNRRRIRRIYERYLKLLRSRNFFRQPQDSSQDIIEKTRRISAEEPAQALRRLYILARYDPDAAITNAQVREARKYLQMLKEEPKS